MVYPDSHGYLAYKLIGGIYHEGEQVAVAVAKGDRIHVYPPLGLFSDYRNFLYEAQNMDIDDFKLLLDAKGYSLKKEVDWLMKVEDYTAKGAQEENGILTFKEVYKNGEKIEGVEMMMRKSRQIFLIRKDESDD